MSLSFKVSKMQFGAAGVGNLGRHQDEFLLLIFLIGFFTLDEPPGMWIVSYTSALFSCAQLQDFCLQSKVGCCHIKKKKLRREQILQLSYDHCTKENSHEMRMKI